MAIEHERFDNFDHLEPIPYQYGIVVTGCTMVAFFALNRFVYYMGPPKHVAVKDSWKWRNLFGSWFHALIIGSWDISCFLMFPDMVVDLVGYHDMYSYTMIAVTTGYFFYDFVDIVISGRTRTSWEVLLHHVVVAGTFFYNLILCRCIAYTAVALLAEVNSFFLHSRKLMQMLQIRFDAPLYRLNVYLNLLSFILCRFIPLIWIIYGMLMWYYRVEPSYLIILSLDLFVMWVVNIVLFWRLLTNDIIRPTKTKSPAPKQQNGLEITANNNKSHEKLNYNCNGSYANHNSCSRDHINISDYQLRDKLINNHVSNGFKPKLS
ncbi:hypothetical protein LSH36_71g00007 [Paralvinella palmiformis]|uniref:TLC domain-containing protein n=1 Tax=Paralvinella palmiformis TaxID=53620 RepID=A0AAD9NBJ0_9ANNE|nr:hypothetical protein LSH36_71g00007 [Paralvinella palmiformis]